MLSLSWYGQETVTGSGAPASCKIPAPRRGYAMQTTIEAIKGALMRKRRKRKPRQELLSTGSTALNLACSDRHDGAYVKGHYYYFVGDSQSGKTWLALSSFAELCRNPAFDDYQLVYDNAEDGALMDMRRFFGDKVADRLVPPAYDEEGRPVFSDTAESFYYHVADAAARGPCFYVLDSMDALQTCDDKAKFEEHKKAWEEGKEAKGSYGMAKAKINSTHLREALRACRDTGSILIIISQTRDNVGFGFETRTRGGGRALTFYATLEIWTSVVGKITKTVNGKKRQLGVRVEARVKKNRVSGKDRMVEIPIYHSFGIDDVGACVDYLIDEKRWKKKGQTIVADDFDFQGSRDKLIRHIEENDLETDLHDIMGTVWREIEEACAIQRKRRYE